MAAALAASWLLILPAFAAAARAEAGEGIYLHGVAGTGEPLVANRGPGQRIEGAAGACVNCHQRSGFGGKEGRSTIPPITGRYLFRPMPTDAAADRGIPYVEGMRGEREPYNDATLARAIRDGIDSQGRTLSSLMPRFALGDADMAALVAYLKKLDRRKLPGVTESTLHFATIITPDADPIKKRGMLAVMRQFFADRNVRQMELAPQMQSSAKTAYTRSMFMVHRRWELRVWELTGPEATWQRQLDERLAAEPVFAVVSGLGGRNWMPVHAFCVRVALPCLFPNVEVPPATADQDFYSVYYSRGVLLEAELMARSLLDGADGMPVRRVLQVVRAGDSSEAGAAALAAALTPRGIVVDRKVIAADASGSDVVPAALRAGGDADAVVLWLRPADLRALPATPPVDRPVYLSGLLGGLERAPLPAAWRAGSRMAYPFDLPDKRRVRVDYALGWIHGRRIPVVDEQVQTDTYLALGLVSEVVKHMVDNFVRDYLVERMENMIEHRIVTGYYPRLTLGAQQRFASKGGYLVRWTDAVGAKIAPDGAWTVP